MRRNLVCLMFVCFAVLIDAVFDIVENVDLENHPGNLFSTNLKYHGRIPRPISGNITFLKDLTDKHRMSVDIKRIENGQMVDFPGLINRTICKAIKLFYNPYLKTTLRTGKNTNLNFKKGKMCPLKKGTYWVKNIVYDVNKWKTYWWTPGSYYVNFTIFNENGKPGGKIAFQIHLKEI
nr:uncharacterized protein LOC123002736 [Drosophila takahashii]